MISFLYDSSSRNMYVHMESIQKEYRAKEGGISFDSYEKVVGGL